MTGLVTAYRLTQAGRPVTLVEAGNEVGGLAGSFSVNGEALEKAYHHLFKSDKAILDLIEELGIEERMEWCKSSVGLYRNGKVWPFMTPLDLLRFKPCSLDGRIRIGLVSLYIKFTKKWQPLAGKSALEWMTKYCGKSATETVWGPLLRGKFDKYASQISMAWLWARLNIRTNSKERGEQEELLGYINGGFAVLVEALKQKIIAGGGEVLVNTRASDLSQTTERQYSVSLNNEARAFGKVVFTGSSRSFLRATQSLALPAEYVEKVGSVDYLGAMCLIFSSKQKLGDYYWTNVNEDDAPFLVFIRHTKLIDSARYNGEEVYYIGAYCDQTQGLFCEEEAAIEAKWFSYITKMFPAFDFENVSSKSLFKFKDAQHVVKPEYEKSIVDYESPLAGLYLANFTQIYPEDRGTNFSVEEGNKVSARLLS